MYIEKFEKIPGTIIINNSIVADSSLTVDEVCYLVEEYASLNIKDIVYTANVLEKKWKLFGMFVSNFKSMSEGCTFGYMNDKVEKISPHFCVLTEPKMNSF